jgi:hypothetical protein
MHKLFSTCLLLAFLCVGIYRNGGGGVAGESDVSVFNTGFVEYPLLWTFSKFNEIFRTAGWTGNPAE